MSVYDVIIIGAGSAGLSALREIKKRTDNFLLINSGPYGTTCARVGCMPSKALIESARAFHHRHKLETFGIRHAESLQVDIPSVMRRVRSLRDDFVAGVLKSTADLGEQNITGHAHFLAPDCVEIDGKAYKARRIIIATGSHPFIPEGWRGFGDAILTTDTLFEQKDLPARMAVVGMGAIGTECAQAFSHLGISVTTFNRGSQLAGLDDPDINAVFRQNLEQEFTIHTGAEVEISAGARGLQVKQGHQVVEVDKVLVAMGRRPNLEGLGLNKLGINLDSQGFPVFDKNTLRILGMPIYIAGDANGDLPLLHEAADEGYIAGMNALAPQDQHYRRRIPLGIVFCEPGVAYVGQRWHEVKTQQPVVGEVDFSRQGRARIAQVNKGLLRVYVSREKGRLLGAEFCAPAAEHLAHLLALALNRQMTVQDLLGMPFYHPVLEEGLRTALRDAARQLPSPTSDLALCQAACNEALD